MSTHNICFLVEIRKTLILHAEKDDDLGILQPLQQYLNHIETMEG